MFLCQLLRHPLLLESGNNMTIQMVMACNKLGVVGKDNKLPWAKNSADLKEFNRLTRETICIMGRLTYQSIYDMTGGPLKDRTNWVVTSKPEGYAYSTFVDISNVWFDKFDKVLALSRLAYGNPNYVVNLIGGPTLCKHFLELGLVDSVVISVIDDISTGDSYLPKLPAGFRVGGKKVISEDCTQIKLIYPDIKPGDEIVCNVEIGTLLHLIKGWN